MRLEGQLGRIGDGLQSYGRLVKGLGPNGADPELAALGEQLRLKAASPDLIEVRGRIVGDSWRIEPSRRFFFIANVQGTLRSIVAECDTRRIELAFNPEDDYGLPDALGNCTIFVQGDRNTDFSFVEALPPE
jgi:hypothetical protein